MADAVNDRARVRQILEAAGLLTQPGPGLQKLADA